MLNKLLSIAIMISAFIIFLCGGLFSFFVCLMLGIAIWPLKPSLTATLTKHHKGWLYIVMVLTVVISGYFEITFMKPNANSNKKYHQRKEIITKVAKR